MAIMVKPSSSVADLAVSAGRQAARVTFVRRNLPHFYENRKLLENLHMASGKVHSYTIRMRWTGNTGQGTREYRSYDRAHEYSVEGKPVIPGSSDPAFRGDAARYNPEELLVMSLSSCHMLWYLHLCADNKIEVVDYVDDAVGKMVETGDTGGHFVDVLLKPAVTLAAGSDVSLAERLHDRAHHLCYVANSVNFPVRCDPTFRLG
jgi:organic hydroperoxide reductase OsmC/OhrA